MQYLDRMYYADYGKYKTWANSENEEEKILALINEPNLEKISKLLEKNRDRLINKKTTCLHTKNKTDSI